MIPNSCIKFETSKFPALEGEDEEIVNEGMYGKALCQYLQERLPSTGLLVPAFCNEDWGWWLDVEDGDFAMALCIYSEPDAEGEPESYAILPSIDSAKRWSWSKFGKVDISENVLAIIDKVVRVLESDPEISQVTRHNDFPY